MERRQGVELYLGIGLIMVLTAFAVMAPLFANYDPHQTDTERWLQAPGREHFFGTDRSWAEISTVVWCTVHVYRWRLVF